MEYYCECCKYRTNKRFNYDKHLSSKKHCIADETYKKQPKTTFESPKSQHLDIPKSTQIAEKVATDFTCKYCDQQFRFKQSMYRHIKYTCTKNKDEISKEGVELLKKRIEQHEMNIEIQKQMLHDIIDKQSLIIDKLMKNVEIQGSFNTTNNIQNIHLDTGNKLEELYKRLVERHQDSYEKSTDSLETIL